jgi:hypothetical protein
MNRNDESRREWKRRVKRYRESDFLRPIIMDHIKWQIGFHEEYAQVNRERLAIARGPLARTYVTSCMMSHLAKLGVAKRRMQILMEIESQ